MRLKLNINGNRKNQSIRVNQNYLVPYKCIQVRDEKKTIAIYFVVSQLQIIIIFNVNLSISVLLTKISSESFFGINDLSLQPKFCLIVASNEPI